MTGAISAAITDTRPAGGTDWLALARELGPAVASRAAAYDANRSFPLQNYRERK
jgi:hypothetical protein